MTNLECDVLIVGGGVIGLACARQLASTGVEVVLVERADDFGTITSSRHSEVIHAGIYYTPGSLKARSCVEGRRLLYDYLDAKHIPYQKISKLIFACSKEELRDLELLYQRGLENEVEGLSLLGQTELKRLESELDAYGAIHSAETGIFDSHLYLKSLEQDARDYGASLALKTSFKSARKDGDDWTVCLCTSENESIKVRSRWLINTAGHRAHAVAKQIAEYPKRHLPRRYLAKGTYWSTSQNLPFKRLLYPMPNAAGLGIHLTFDLNGAARFGPDVTWVDEERYEVDASQKEHFIQAIQSYFPGLDPERLHPDYAGIRPKLVGPGEPAHDFVIQGPGDHSCMGLMHCFGVESPGLTASLALARMIERLTAF